MIAEEDRRQDNRQLNILNEKKRKWSSLQYRPFLTACGTEFERSVGMSAGGEANVNTNVCKNRWTSTVEHICTDTQHGERALHSSSNLLLSTIP
jgi:hypothetical protein